MHRGIFHLSDRSVTRRGRRHAADGINAAMPALFPAIRTGFVGCLFLGLFSDARE
jgi:hypothetical protein